MKAANYIRAIIYLTVLVWTVALFLYGQAVTLAWVKPLSIATTIVLGIVLAFDLWVWRWRLLHGWFVKRPVISGTWETELRSNWIDPATGQRIPPLKAYAVIRQTLSMLSIRLLTPESRSELVGTEIVCAPDGSYCVSGVYRNEPRLEVRDRSPIHYGAVWLNIVENPTKAIVGHYWTDRGTAGEMEMTNQKSARFQTFEAAQAYYMPR